MTRIAALRRELLPAALVVLASFWFYRGAVADVFFGNDLMNVYTAIDLPSDAAVFGRDATVAAHVRNDGPWMYRPLALLLYRLYHRLFGFDFLPWHLVNVAVHAANAALAYALLRRFLPAPWGAAGAAVLWSLGFSKADAVMWMTCVHAYAGHLLLWGLLLAGRPGAWSVAGQLGCVAAAALLHESSWTIGGVLLYHAVRVRRGDWRAPAAFAAALAALALPFAALYLHLHRAYPTSVHSLSLLGAVANWPAMAASLVVPFPVLFNRLNGLLEPLGVPRIGVGTVLPVFWAGVAFLGWRLARALPRLPRLALRDRVLEWALVWTAVSLVPNAMVEGWLHGRDTYLSGLGFVLALGRFAGHWGAAAPRRGAPRAALRAAATVFVALQLLFSVKARAHMSRGHREIPAMIEALRATEPPPRPGETWVITGYPWHRAEWEAFLRFAYGRAPALLVSPGEGPASPPRPFRRFRYDVEAVPRVGVR